MLQTLGAIYSAYEADPTSFPSVDIPGTSNVLIQGTNVGIQVQDGNPVILVPCSRNCRPRACRSPSQRHLRLGCGADTDLAASCCGGSPPGPLSVTPEYQPITQQRRHQHRSTQRISIPERRRASPDRRQSSGFAGSLRT